MRQKFYDAHKEGKPDSVEFLLIQERSLRLTYNDIGQLSNVAAVSSADDKPTGMQLFLDHQNSSFVLKSEGNISGEFWKDGKSQLGTVYDDVEPETLKEISFEDWIDESIERISIENK